LGATRSSQPGIPTCASDIGRGDPDHEVIEAPRSSAADAFGKARETLTFTVTPSAGAGQAAIRGAIPEGPEHPAPKTATPEGAPLNAITRPGFGNVRQGSLAAKSG
jgi:hypothetical protein